MQGTKNEAAAGRVLDLDAQLAARMLEPAPVRLGGHVYQVRTDLTAKEVVEYLAAARAGKDGDAFALLVGKKDASRLNSALETMPKRHVDMAVRALMRASIALADHAAAGSDELSLDVSDVDERESTEGGSSAS